MSKNTFVGRVCGGLERIRETSAVRAFNSFMASPKGLMVVAALTLLSNVFSLELVLYTVTVLYGIYLCLLGDDFLTLMPFFVFCYIAPSRANNPGKSDTSIFAGTSGIFLLVAVGVLLICFLLRVGLDPKVGFKRFMTHKRTLLWGMLALGAMYMLSGLFSKQYEDIWYKNIFFGFVQFATIFAAYFIFTATVDWSKARKDYFAWLGFLVGCVIALEIIYLYCAYNGEFMHNGSIKDRWEIYLGWGMNNNIGAMLAITMPFPFYLAARYNHGYLFTLPAVGMVVTLFMTASRASILFGVLAFTVSAAMMILYSKKRLRTAIVAGTLCVVALVMIMIFKEDLEEIFSVLFDNGLLNDSGRIKLYESGIEVFLKNLFFGEGFYPSDMAPFKDAYWFKGADMTDFLPPRWHNTVVQLLASCGALGLLAYSFHRVQTILMFFKKRNPEKMFIGVSVLCLLGTSLLDCHFFNLGPTLFYSLMLTFAECSERRASEL